MRERPDTQAERFRREWWLLAGLWLALGALIAVVLSLERRDTEERERQQVAHQVHIVHENLERQLHAVNQALGDIVANLAQWRARPEGALPFNERLRAFSDAMTGVRTLTVLDAEGTVVASSRAELLGENFAYRDYFQSARRLASREQPSLIVSAPMRTVLGIWAITLSRPVVAEDGLPGGVVAATLDPDEFKTLLDSVRYAPDVESTLVHGDGVRFLRVPERAGLLGATLAQPGTLFQAHLDSGRMESLFVGAMEPDPTERLVALHTIFPAHLHMDKPLVAAVARDWSQVFAAWRARLDAGRGMAADGGCHWAGPGLHAAPAPPAVAPRAGAGCPGSRLAGPLAGGAARHPAGRVGLGHGRGHGVFLAGMEDHARLRRRRHRRQPAGMGKPRASRRSGARARRRGAPPGG